MATLPKIVAIVGPTASGKSALGIKLAKKFNGEIVSADSRQIYKDMNIGTGKVTKKEMAAVKHYLLDVASPRRTFTVSQYVRLAEKAIREIRKKGKLPIIVGGTGFYIQALVDGITIPKVPPNPKLRRELEKKSREELLHLLEEKDPERAQTIEKKNKRRLIRALEIIEALGKVPKIQKNPKYLPLFIGITKDREELKRSIKQRLLSRLRQGMIEEVKKLHKKEKLSWQRLENFGLEYRYIAYYLQGKIPRRAMIEQLEKAINDYARRQMTWFKRDKRIYWISGEKEANKFTREFLAKS
ncbi:MAG: tRNA (adenosine(37)-N6)-dimethylallyltransferase MiaA [Parcubacteria group bacterium]|nr:tRNA (adenosine(37)-N6)-dimethylallyltransferase MiaA [Parcubacteria group bacterium]